VSVLLTVRSFDGVSALASSAGRVLPPTLVRHRRSVVDFVVHRDLDVPAERVRNGTERGRLRDVAREPRSVEPRYPCADGKLDGGYPGSAVDLVERARPVTLRRSGGMRLSPSTSASAIAKQLA